MLVGHDDALGAHLEALVEELGRLSDRLAGVAALPTPPGQPTVTRVAPPQSRRRATSGPRRPTVGLEPLHRLALIAEDLGWLNTGEAIMLRKLAFRVAFYLRRRESIHP